MCGSLDALPSLKVLDLSSNGLATTAGLARCTGLTDCWLGSNRIAAFGDALAGLAALPHLEVVYLEHNPLAGDWEYRLRLAAALPALKQLDATAVSGR